MTDNRDPNKLTQADYDDFVTSFNEAAGYTYEKMGKECAGEDKEKEFLLPCFINPNHRDKRAILERIILLDTTYSTNLTMDKGGVFKTFTEFILSHADEFELLEKDKLDENTLVELVHDLTNANVGKGRRAFSFATKYCAHINPNRCPIYDNIVADCLGKWYGNKAELKRFAGIETNSVKEKSQIEPSYEKYIALYKEFQAQRTVGLNFRQIDKILWWGWKERKEEASNEFYHKLKERIWKVITENKRIAPNN